MSSSHNTEVRPPEGHIAVRRVAGCDVAAICAIEQRCFGAEGEAFSRRQITYLAHKAQGVCLGAYDATDRIVGYISLLTRHGAGNVRIYSVAVDPSVRGLGAGQALVAEAIAYARRGGFREVTLEVRTDNASALALYTKNGFRPDRLLPGYYHDGADAQHMALSIG